MHAGFSEEFGADLARAFAERMSLPTALMSKIEDDTSPKLAQAQKALADMGMKSSTLRDRVLLREACVCISTRAARLSAVGVASLLEQMGHARGERCTIAVDGTVFECYPFFKERMEAGLDLLMGESNASKVELVLAKDGSGVGAAIIAAISS